MGKKKQKKEKIRYIDDGRSLADMSNVKGGMDWTKKGTTSRPSDIWRTYWNAVKMMFKPMMVTIGFIIAAYLIIRILFLIFL